MRLPSSHTQCFCCTRTWLDKSEGRPECILVSVPGSDELLYGIEILTIEPPFDDVPAAQVITCDTWEHQGQQQTRVQGFSSATACSAQSDSNKSAPFWVASEQHPFLGCQVNDSTKASWKGYQLRSSLPCPHCLVGQWWLGRTHLVQRPRSAEAVGGCSRHHLPLPQA